MWFIMFWFVGTAAGIVTGIENPGMRSLQSICSNLLLYQLTITVAATGLWCFIGHVFKSVYWCGHSSHEGNKGKRKYESRKCYYGYS